MGHNLEGNKIKVMVRDSYRAGYVARSISKIVFHRIREVGLIYIVYKKRRQLGMLDKAFLESMQCWITSKWITRNILSIWNNVNYEIGIVN